MPVIATYAVRSIPPALSNSEDGRRKVNARRFDLVHKLGPQTRRAQAANYLAVFNAGLLEDKDIGHGNDVTFHATDLSDVDNFA